MTNHRPDYSQEYIVPDLVTISQMIQSTRDGLITHWIGELSPEELNKMLLVWMTVLPDLITPPQALSKKRHFSELNG